MDESKFWDIIECFNWDQEGDDDAVMEPAYAVLATLDDESIFKFDDILSEKLYALDTREHCRACYKGELDPDDGDDYISADGFLYARCVVVVNGRDFYASVLADPTAMPQDSEFESLLSLPASAYERKTGKEYEHVSPISYESFENLAGWAPTAETRSGKFTGDGIPPGNRRPT
ncbi:MAG: DUF4240 domain-containing protein [Planctomycetaceae bacterium]|nr:DUF4240 domain-containing protein [Planctomycetaceae bacterium]